MDQIQYMQTVPDLEDTEKYLSQLCQLDARKLSHYLSSAIKIAISRFAEA